MVSIEFEKFTLDNGLDVILSEDHSLPVTAVNIWYHVGSKDEPQGRSGFAHLFEHLMFNGSKHHDGEYFAPLQPLGARVNGTTSTERTNYYETVPSNAVERALWLEADRMGFLLPVLTQEKLDNQRDVVRNERRQNYEIRPYAVARKAVVEAVWPKEHPYYRLTIGSHEDLEAASLDDVRTFFDKWYAPNNATLCVSGSFDEDQVRGWIERYFGPIGQRGEPKHLTEAATSLPQAQTVVLDDDVKLARVLLVWQSPALFAQGDADLDVLSSILSSGKSSRLHKRLVFEDRIAKDVSAAQYSAGLGSTYRVVATVAPGHSVEEVTAALREELAALVADGVTEAEVSRAKNNWRKSFFHRIESVAGKAGLLQSYNHHRSDPGFVGSDLQRYLDVTADSVKQWAAEVMKVEHEVVVVVKPKDSAEGATP